MTYSLKSIVIRTLPIVDVILCPFVFLAAGISLLFRKLNCAYLPLSRGCFRAVGIWPLRRQYYDPLFDPKDLSYPLTRKRLLPGLDLNISSQLALLSRLRYASEFRAYLAATPKDVLRFSFDNGSFGSGDADFLYSFVREFKPEKVVEVGCGNSTKLIRAAVVKNRLLNSSYQCDHACIEPYEAPWLDSLEVRVIRERVERVSMGTFQSLGAGDLLFIDSSHIIRPCGDVIFEILEVLPTLRSGVYVHFHDIFTPRNYLPEWLSKKGFLWNEQYLLEAFLSNNIEFQVIASLNHVHHAHYAQLAAICAEHAPGLEPGSFYIQKR